MKREILLLLYLVGQGSVLFFVTREIPVLNIRYIVRNGLAHILIQVHIPPQEARMEFVCHAQQVMDDQYLSICMFSCTYTYGWDGYFL